MRIGIIAAFALGAVVLWTYITSGPEGGPGAAQLERMPPTSTKTFASVQQSLAGERELERAQRDGRLIEAPKQHALRAAVVGAADRVDASPCDKQARESLRAAVVEFENYQDQIEAKPSAETAMVDGRIVDARDFLNKKAIEISKAARVAGVVPTSGLLFGQGRADNRFQCSQRG